MKTIKLTQGFVAIVDDEDFATEEEASNAFKVEHEKKVKTLTPDE